MHIENSPQEDYDQRNKLTKRGASPHCATSRWSPAFHDYSTSFPIASELAGNVEYYNNNINRYDTSIQILTSEINSVKKERHQSNIYNFNEHRAPAQSHTKRIIVRDNLFKQKKAYDEEEEGFGSTESLEQSEGPEEDKQTTFNDRDLREYLHKHLRALDRRFSITEKPTDIAVAPVPNLSSKSNTTEQEVHIENQPSTAKCRRPTPAGIPLVDYISAREEKRPQNILNFSFKQSHIDSDAICDKTIKYIYNYVPETEDLFQLHCENFPEEEYQNQQTIQASFEVNEVEAEYAAQIAEEIEEETVKFLSHGYEHYNNNSMGLNIFNRLRKYLSFESSSSNQENRSDQENSARKRRQQKQENNPQIKYRRVENRFPRIISHTLDDDNNSAFVSSQKHMNSTSSGNNYREMSDRGKFMGGTAMGATAKPKPRKSIFNVPQQTHKLVRNTVYDEVNLSDDDDDAQLSYIAAVKRNSNGVKNLWSVPQVNRRPLAEPQMMQPPPLFDPRTGNMLLLPKRSPPPMPKSEPIPTAPTYADILRRNNASVTTLQSLKVDEHERPPSTVSSMAQSNSILGLCGRNRFMRSSLWATDPHTILAKESEYEEHQQYQRLVEEATAIPLQKASARTIGTTLGSSTQRHILDSTSLRPSGRPSINHQQQRRSNMAAPLSSTRNFGNDQNKFYVVDDDDDDVVEVTNDFVDDGDLSFMGAYYDRSRNVLRESQRKMMSTIVIDGDDDNDDVSEVIDTAAKDMGKLVQNAWRQPTANESCGSEQKSETFEKLPQVNPVNTLEDRLKGSKFYRDNWVQMVESNFDKKKGFLKNESNRVEGEAHRISAQRRAAEISVCERLRNFALVEPQFVIEDDDDTIEPPQPDLIEFYKLTNEDLARINYAVCGLPDTILIEKFNMKITRRDMQTLHGKNWLNDEVINFYMSLLMDRSEKKSDSLPRVHAMNTFFVQTIMQRGYAGVKRWTRKIDIFEKDIIPVPVHVGGVHWCMAIIHFKNKTIQYYDSMGNPNPNVLRALENYLKEESLDKRKQPFDTSGFTIESMVNVPHQTNGSDCGVFSCMFAEYITRNKSITFNQDHMQYFRQKMILEIVNGQLCQ